jgi:hypothetical protein
MKIVEPPHYLEREAKLQAAYLELKKAINVCRGLGVEVRFQTEGDVTTIPVEMELTIEQRTQRYRA